MNKWQSVYWATLLAPILILLGNAIWNMGALPAKIIFLCLIVVVSATFLFFAKKK